MNKKRLVFGFFLTIFLVSSFVLAQETQNLSKVDSAYQCVKDKVGTDCSKLTYEEQAFSLLSLGDVEDCSIEFLANSENEECWPKGNCKLKDTTIAMVALDHIGENTDKIQSWLLNQTKVASALLWYLEIDADDATTCDISYDSKSTKISINEDKTIAGVSDSCFSLSSGNYWLQIANNCLEKEFVISCDKDFKSTLLYQTQSSSTIHVSQSVHSSVASGTTNEKVNFKCFEQGTTCNFEGSLWATWALNKKGESILPYLPYIKAFAPENKGEFPEAFLYILTGAQEYLTSTINDNFKTNYWQVGTKNKEYNTAIAFMALGDSSIPQIEKAKNFFLNNQGADGCWNNVRDTGFLLYTGWPKSSTKPISKECSVNGDCLSNQECVAGFCKKIGTPNLADCESSGFFCENSFNCEPTQVLNGYSCLNPGKICCSEKLEKQTCSAQLGKICSSDEECPRGNYLTASDVPLGECCATSCQVIAPTPTPDVEDLCQDNRGSCKTSCSSNEEVDSSLSCGESSGQICCKEKKGSLFWVWFFLILIVLIIILILLRNKIRLLIFRVKSKFSKKPLEKPRPASFNSSPPPNRFPPQTIRPMYRPLPPPQRPANRPVSKKDSDFDETLKKLREMSK